MRLRWLPLAAANRAEQLAYIAARNPRAAIDLGDAIKVSIARLQDQPMIGRESRISGTRELIIGRTPYLAIYKVEEDTVSILRFLHGAQQWPPALPDK